MAGGYRHYKNDEDTDTIKIAGGYRHCANDWRIQIL
jgi:hypothetical protein